MINSIVQKLGRIPFHPLVFAAFPILSLFVQNLGKGYLREALLITAGALLLAALLWLLVNLLVRDWDRSAIVVSAFFLLFFSYGHARSAVAGLLAALNLEDKTLALLHSGSAKAGWLVLWGLLFALACYLTIWLLRKPDVAKRALNLMSLSLLVVLVVNAFTTGGLPALLRSHVGAVTQAAEDSATPSSLSDSNDATSRAIQPLPTGTRQRMTSSEAEQQSDEAIQQYSDLFQGLWLQDMQEASLTPGPQPDIYYIILDKYVRSDFLQEKFGFDNSGFISSLEERGFYVAKKSRANYPYTITSLPSSLNFMHYGELTARNEEFSDFDGRESHWLLDVMIRDSRITRHLRNLGYTTMAFDTGNWWTQLRNADVYLELPSTVLDFSEFQQGVLDLTPLSSVLVIQRSRDEAKRQRILFTLDHIADAARDDVPTYVFAHIMSPHPPYVFQADGTPVQHQAHYTFDEYVEAYTGQVAHINSRIVELVDEILAESPSPPIIIIQADHGTCYGTESEFEPCMAERMSIFNAYYFPDEDYRDLYDGITPVNTFRIVLNRYFGTGYPLLDDRSYYSLRQSYFVFTDVTDRVSGDR